ncbi:MAG: Uncharacterized protein conserved in bacteria [uncultured Thiotrichaceae bacterium]|uniref:Uncharacterized protein conserved in bacteria n=1 Tax=uncultured Thiotrichaceae bacterium TaxID=298394 RepID=A0A6S6T0G5_9GAMM|nr:MAG: Uncharacterized protein conserved in bacteria [uncultured Thiotrichaceae bacterium]
MVNWVINQVYAAQTTQRLGEKEKQTGIFKQPLPEAATVDENGIVGDIQADKTVHGGPEKALHQYAVASYLLMQKAFPELSDKLIIGSLGENISARGMHEHNVFIGDIYRMGGITVQVSQPRQPCWKINSKFDDPRLVKFVTKTYTNGWYFRVLEGGEIAAGHKIELLERPNDLSVYHFLRIYTDRQPSEHYLKMALQCQGLNPAWQEKLQQRFEHLYGSNH